MTLYLAFFWSEFCVTVISCRRGVWRNIWRGSMLPNIGCLTNLVVPLWVKCSSQFLDYLDLCSFLSSVWCLLILLCRLPSHRLGHTNQESACHWSLFCGTGWSTPSHTVRSLPFWCSDIFWLMGRLGLIRPTLQDSWVWSLVTSLLVVYW